MLKQQFLPGFPDGAVRIGEMLSILTKDGRVTYFIGSDSYFDHALDDKQSMRLVLASLMHHGHVRACHLEAKPLAIPHRTLMNWLAQYRSDGPGAFYRTNNVRQTRILTPEKKVECASLIAGGARPAEVARQTGIADSTLRKALKRKTITLLPESRQEISRSLVVSTKSGRSCIDAQAASAMGTACTRADERMATRVRQHHWSFPDLPAAIPSVYTDL